MTKRVGAPGGLALLGPSTSGRVQEKLDKELGTGPVGELDDAWHSFRDA